MSANTSSPDVVSLLQQIIEQNKQILSNNDALASKLEQYSSREKAMSMSEEIKHEIVQKILNSPLNVSFIPDALESQIYECVLDTIFKYLPIL